MAVNVLAIIDAIMSPMMASGRFARVNGFEPKGSPGSGLTAAVWLDAMTAAPAASGLAASSARIVFKIRLYTSMLSEPQDAIDPEVLDAAVALFGIFAADFDLSGTVRNVDLHGGHGPALSAQAGYLNVSGQMMRVVDVTLPVIVNDAWEQSA